MLFKPFACLQCVDASRESDHPGRVDIEEVVITHEAAALMTCPFGHQRVLIFQEGAYALLYERALQRLAIGAPRDALLDAYTALEMFFATIPERVRFEMHEGQTDLAIIREELRDATKTSERAMAAALAAISILSNRSPPKIPSRLSELRNQATHAGRYPRPEDAEWAVLEVERIVREFDALLPYRPDRLKPYPAAVFALAHAAQAKKYPGIERSSASLPLVFDALATKTARHSAVDRLQEYRAGEPYLRLG